MVAQAQTTNTRPLTPKEEAFAQYIAKGKAASEAYRLAYDPKGQPHTFRSNAYQVGRRPHVAARIDELKKPDQERLFLTRARKREILFEIAQNRRNKPVDRARAIDLDNQMTAEYTQNVRVEGEVTLGIILSKLGLTTGIPQADEVKALAQPIDVQAVAPEASLPDPLEAKPAPVRGPLDDDLEQMGIETPPAKENASKGPSRRFYQE
jgi:hypothetical protein